MLELIEDLGMQYPNEKSKQKRRFGLYLCECGNKIKTQTYSVKAKVTQSCGCLAKENNIKHSLCRHRLYRIFTGMKTRCYNKNNFLYEYYGARGIKICDLWLNDFIAFYNWAINNGYSDNLTIDRINNNGKYEPSNCRWVNQEIQIRNTRRIIATNTSGYKGVHWDKKKKKWVSRITVDNIRIVLGNYDCRLAGAYAREDYIIKNNLEHTKNFN